MATFNQGAPTVPTLINSSSTILTGNAASANALTVRQFGGGNVFSAQTTTGSTALFVNAAGNVGIGTASPQRPLHVVLGASGSVAAFVSTGVSGAYSNVDITSYLNTSNVPVCRIAVIDDGLNSGHFTVLTKSPTGVENNVLNERFRINSAGNVGINQASPQTLFHVTATASNSAIFIDNSLGSIGPRPLATNAGSANCHIWADGAANGTADGGFLRIAAGGGAGIGNKSYIDLSGYSGTADMNQNIVFGTQGAERMRIRNDGNVGIGTTSPGYPLDVSGIIRGNTEIISNTATAAGQFRAISGNYGFFIRNDGTDSYLLHTASGDPYGSYNSNRPFRINNASALVTMGNGLNVSGGSGYTLDVSGDINASSTLRIGGLTQPRLISSGTFTGVTSFDTVTFDLVNYNVVEIRMTVYFNTTNQRIMSSQLLDTGGTVYSATESGWQMFYNTGGVAASGAGAYILNNTEIAGNGVGGFIVVIRLIGNMGISGSVRNHWEWTTTGCYAGIGASTTYGRATPYNTSGATMNRMRFNLSGGTMTGKYSIINYST